jgi:hypothetical protein
MMCNFFGVCHCVNLPTDIRRLHEVNWGVSFVRIAAVHERPQRTTASRPEWTSDHISLRQLSSFIRAL